MVHGRDHLPPHFHVIHPDFEALVEIGTRNIIAGSMPTAVAKKVYAWADATWPHSLPNGTD